ncbi:MAG: transcription termination/antitermination NusG family protein, partial [Odoribacter splanchnicus]
MVHWHAVFTASRAEKKVRDRLEELGVECFLPVQTVLRQWT